MTSKYTVEQIKKAKRFRVTKAGCFSAATVVGKWHELRPGRVSQVVHADDSGWKTPHVLDDGELSTKASAAIAAGAIEYDIPDEKPKRQPTFFKIDEYEMHCDGGGCIWEYRIITDANGGLQLREMQRQIVEQNEIARLERQRDELDAKIAKLKEAAE